MKYEDAVYSAEGGKPVCDDESGASAAEFVEIVSQAGFGFEVECASGLIEDDDRRITEKNPLQVLPPEFGLVVLAIRSSPTRRR